MDEKTFESIRAEIGGKSKIEQIIRELFTTEFKDIQQRKVRLHITKIQRTHRAIAIVKSDDVRIELFLDSDYLDNIKFFEGKNEGVVRKLLRHEFEHIKSGLNDDDPEFWEECLKKGIPVSP